jgi:hypothetical protein
VIYKVIIQPPAEADIDLAYRYIAQYSIDSADRWFNGLYDAIMITDDAKPLRLGERKPQLRRTD